MLPGVFVPLRRAYTISPAMKAATLLALSWKVFTRLAASGLCTTTRLVLKIHNSMRLIVICCHQPHLAPRQVKYSSCR